MEWLAHIHDHTWHLLDSTTHPKIVQYQWYFGSVLVVEGNRTVTCDTLGVQLVEGNRGKNIPTPRASEYLFISEGSKCKVRLSTHTNRLQAGVHRTGKRQIVTK